MSNTVVGAIYAQIIEKIIEAAKNDFEEGGYDQSTLLDLKDEWQRNLSKLRVAQCPWDPPPQQQQPVVNPPTVPSNAAKGEPSPLHNGDRAGQPYIKQEIRYESGVGNYPPTGYSANPIAQQRASVLLQQQFGAQAIPSLQAAGLNHQPPRAPMPTGQRPQHIELPGPAQPRGPLPQYPQPQQHNSVGAAQTDGAGEDADMEWSNHLALTQSMSGERRVWVDGLLRAQLEEQIARTDSGLMMPLSEQPYLKSKKRKVLNQYMAKLSVAESSNATTVTAPYVPQYDGGDDDSDNKEEVKAKIKADEDEDAINSDLDDDDEEERSADGDSGEGPVGETILCTYDKVQRVKNKWKCTLKDGILTTGGKEYVFHKASGEFEW